MKEAAHPGSEVSTVLLVLPSEGLGGGIERCCDWLADALSGETCRVEKTALLHPGQAPTIARKLKFLVALGRTIRRAGREPVSHVVICHPGLVRGVTNVMRLLRSRPVRLSILFYGQDIWGASVLQRRYLRHVGASLLTISRYSAGALTSMGSASVVPTGLATSWYALLAAVARPPREQREAFQIMTAFRLDSAEDKGLSELVAAIETVRKVVDIRLIVAGSGTLSNAYRQLLRDREWATVVNSPSDQALARLYARADLFVLATRTRLEPPTSGEGLGLVLVEAQLTGTPVVAPAFGGSDDAFLAGTTGLKPVDESSEALAQVLRTLTSDRRLCERLGANARAWAVAEFAPERRRKAARQMLGVDSSSPLEPLPLSVRQLP